MAPALQGYDAQVLCCTSDTGHLFKNYSTCIDVLNQVRSAVSRPGDRVSHLLGTYYMPGTVRDVSCTTAFCATASAHHAGRGAGPLLA